jgi:hypothetical protein
MRDYKDSVKVATTSSVDLLSPPMMVDGISLGFGDRILVWKQTPPSGKSFSPDNGLYTSTGTSWVRSEDMDEGHELSPGVMLYVENGVVNSKKVFICTSVGDLYLGNTGLRFEDLSDVLNISNVIVTDVNLHGKIIANGQYYTTIQAAYDAVVSLDNPAMIVGDGMFGNLVLQDSSSVSISGCGRDISRIGSITVGSGESVVNVHDLSAGDVYTNGNISFKGSSSTIGNIIGGHAVAVSGNIVVGNVEGFLSLSLDDAQSGNVTSSSSNASVGLNKSTCGDISVSLENNTDGAVLSATDSVAGNVSFNLLGTNTGSPSYLSFKRCSVGHVVANSSVNEAGQVYLDSSKCESVTATGTKGGFYSGYASKVYGNINLRGSLSAGRAEIKKSSCAGIDVSCELGDGGVAVVDEATCLGISLSGSLACGALSVHESSVNGPVVFGSGGSCIMISQNVFFRSPSFCVDRADDQSYYTRCSFVSHGTHPCIADVPANGPSLVNCVMMSEAGYSIEGNGSIKAYNLIHNGFSPSVFLSEGNEISVNPAMKL